MEVFSFMAEIKERLQSKMPDAAVSVEPHDRFTVIILVSWRVGEKIGRVEHMISTREIIQYQKIHDRSFLAEAVSEDILFRKEAVHA